jgi:hypothetical protein
LFQQAASATFFLCSSCHSRSLFQCQSIHLAENLINFASQFQLHLITLSSTHLVSSYLPHSRPLPIFLLGILQLQTLSLFQC